MSDLVANYEAGDEDVRLVTANNYDPEELRGELVAAGLASRC